MESSFYYADDLGNLVGPLSLDEIRRFTEAGVVTPNVMVCEAGGENWRSLNTFDETSSITSPPASASQQVQSAMPSHPARTSENLKVIYMIALALSLVGFGLDASSTRAMLENGGMDPNSIRENVSMLIGLVALGATLTLIFQMVRAIPERHRFTTPVKAAGFYLIPLFSLYWVFRLFPGLVSSVRKWGTEIAPAMSTRISWFLPLAFIAAGLGALSEILIYFEILGYFEHPIDRIARVNHALLYVAYAAAYASFFHFIFCIVHLMRGLLNPEDYEGEDESEKQRGFLTIGPAKWSPSYSYFLFLIVGIGAWR